ncbi:hypothetical protein LSAT2_005093 [Lamellibrachia satsuma]|nr:hypothetical protein LSAT2_005093 [Lamellibrachia satsuma]
MASSSTRKGVGSKTFKRKMRDIDDLKRVDKKCEKHNRDVVEKKVKHPPVAKMVMGAVGALKNNRGSSLQAIRHYLAATYHVNPAKLKTYVRRFVKKALADGTLVQTKGRGAAGLFRLGRRVRHNTTTQRKAGQKGSGQGRTGGEALRARGRQRALERSITDQVMLKTMKKIRKPVAAAMRAAICDTKVPFQCIKRKFSKTPI